MKQLLQNLGLIIFIIAIVLLIIGLSGQRSDNSILIVSGSLIIMGLVVHVVMNKKIM
jgi:hypothetical protein